MPVKMTAEQLDAWVSEAEAGYDVAELKRRGRGRPGRGMGTHLVAVRMTDSEIASLDAIAAQRGVSRSDVLRAGVAALAS